MSWATDEFRSLDLDDQRLNRRTVQSNKVGVLLLLQLPLAGVR
jgi:hypothetical protein